MTTIRLTMAQALVRFLDAQYVSIDGEEIKFVQGVMGIFGHGNVTGIGEALEYSPGSLTLIQGKNEQGMVHAAAAFAKQKNRLQIYACTSSIGPGALNMVTAAGTATVNRIPVLLLPGDNFASRQPDPVLQQLEVASDYTVSATDAFKPVSKYWDRIVRPEQLMSAALQAMRVLTDPAETGAVTLALPQDVQAEAYDYPEAFFSKRIHYIDRRPPAEGAVQRAADLLKGKKKPLIIAGGGVLYASAVSELQDLAETYGIPVAETQAGKSVLPWNHPLNVGGVGVTGTLAANLLAKQADVIIGVGTRYSDFTTSSKSAFADDVQFININVSPLDSAKWGGAALTGDAKPGLTQLAEALAASGYQTAYGGHEVADLKKTWDAEVDRLYSLKHEQGLAQTHALGVIQNTIDPSSVIVCAAGSLPGDLHRLWRPAQPKTYHMEYGFSCMGYEVSGAFGAALATAGEREVYAVVGDGSYFMLHSELITSLQEGVKITILLFDNHGFQCIHNLQRGHGSEGFGNEFRYRDNATGRLTGSYMPIDFTAHARSLGAKAYKANSAEELKAALLQAKQETVSTLIEIPVVPGTNTAGYESWWNVGVPEVSVSNKVLDAHVDMKQRIRAARTI